MSDQPGYLPELRSREEFVDFLEGYALPTVDELENRLSSRKLVKTYMLETVRHGGTVEAVADAFPPRVRLEALDDRLFRVRDHAHGRRIVGLLELLDERHPVFYTTLAANESDKWVRQVVDRNPWLDRLWLSSAILYELWQYVQRTVPSHRYVKLGFDHEAWYESAEDPFGESSVDDGTDDADLGEAEDDTSRALIERRRSRISLTERLSILQDRLPQLVRLYDPLQSLVQLQLPSSGRGGHLLHFDGKATNRSESFVEHRATVGLVLSLYRRLTERAEDQLWVDTTEIGDDGLHINGAPISIRFSEPLSAPTFNRFVELALERRTSRFRIGGYVHRLGPTKVQVTAIDRHLWQPFLLEATSRQLLAILPRGTCGNTIHRMVTNVQRFVDPSVEVWLGAEKYESAVAASFRAAA